MKTPTVGILLAVYNPPLDWFGELLDSLNAQTYQNIRLYARNDSSSSLSPQELENLIAAHISAFPVTVLHNEQNLGSNKTFERLIKDAKEELIAFCDQDDIWAPEKVEKTVKLLLESHLTPKMVCTDVSVIDGNGNEIAPDMQHHRKRHVFLRGNELASKLFYRNFVMGCTMMMRREDALSYLPIPETVVHDHYLAFRSALDGAIDFLAEPQMKYRVYGSNQTGVMVGVTDKKSYEEKRILVFEERLKAFAAGESLPEFQSALKWLEARKKNWCGEKGGFSALWKLRRVNLSTSLFELFARFFPLRLFQFCIRLVQKRVI